MTSDAMETPMLLTRRLAFQRGNEWLFKDLSFEVHAGQLLWLRGQNGRGKTSLLRLLVSLTQPSQGQLHRNGEPSDTRSDLVYIGHANGLKDDLSAAESLAFLAHLHGRDGSPLAVAGALHRLGIHHRRNRLVRTLSQGQRRRVALARLALEKTPTLWVLDEPFDTLDPAGIDIVNSLLLEHLARRGSVILTSHLPLRLPGVPVHELDLDQVAAP